jgi:hypothetical protein
MWCDSRDSRRDTLASSALVECSSSAAWRILRQQARTLDGAAVLEQQVDVEAIASIRGHAAGGGVRLADEALLFEPRQDVPDGGRRHAQRPAPCDDDGGHRLAAVDISRTTVARMGPNERRGRSWSQQSSSEC